MTSKTLVARTELLVDGREIIVSTINRLCSSLSTHDSAYAETMVFEADGYGKFVSLLDQTEASADSLTGHNEMVEKWSVPSGAPSGEPNEA